MEEFKIQSPEEKQRQAEEILSQAIGFLYVNNSYMSISNWDVRLIFCERLPSEKSEQRAAITMSHGHAKALAELLSKNVEKLEAAFGPIRFEPIQSTGAAAIEDLTKEIH